MRKTILIISIAILFASCTAHVHQIVVNNPAGFWLGLWHGIISPITFIISLFSDTVTVWDINNNGGWYTFGFLCGVGSLTGGSTKATNKK